ncbi:MFS transporter [Facilibium subflavum]|uniref:MFS transporter n=1 Tax=Facilibium subflavum TaxID=2219058 RepID=UPI000E64747E|nr:MFS transporter [Facilibium subflavum]
MSKIKSQDNVAKVSVLAGTGGMLEFYDFILYILFSDQITQAFFVDIQSEYIKNLIVVAIFSIAYIVRPIGGFFIGWLGDNIGRKKSFSFTILLMGVCVLLMGIMPTYAQIGLTAPIIFVLLRVIQGFALGGELPGAIVFVYESVERRGLALGIMFAMVFLGFLLGDIMSIVLHAVFGQYAWRAAFISGSFVAFVGFYIRQRLEETKLFSTLKNKQKFPLLVLLKEQFKSQVGAILCVIIVAFNGVVVSLYLPKYLQSHLHYTHAFFDPMVLASAVINIIVIFAASLLTDYINYRKLYVIMAACLIIFSYPAFLLISLNTAGWVFIGIVIISFIPSVTTGLFMRILCESFTTDVRFSGVAIGYNLAFALVGGFAPLVSEVLIHDVNVVFGPSIVGIVCGILGLISMRLLKKRY